MLRCVEVKRFKSLVNLRLDLGRMNVLVGANGSGKSNIIEAIGVLGAAAFGRVDDETLQRRGVRPGVPQLYKTQFPGLSNVPHISFAATGASGALYRVTLWNPGGKPSSAWNYKTETLLDEAGSKVATRGFSKAQRNLEQGRAALETFNLPPDAPTLALMDELRNYSIHCPNTPALRGLVQDLQSREPVGLAGGRLPEAVEEVMEAAREDAPLEGALDATRALIEWALNFDSAPSVGVPLSPSAARSRLVIRFLDRFMARGRDILTGYDASEGALYILYSVVLALHPKAPRLLAVDNIDQAMNPRLATRVMEILCSWLGSARSDRQWIVTAHNPAVLDGLPLDNPDVRLFAVDRNSAGHTVAKHIDLARVTALRPSVDWTLSRMWMNGLIGGVPNV
ncbi:MAG: AAA family ATPase [Candidatus Latescibacterota bacterium]